MSQETLHEILSIAIFQPLPGHEEASLATMQTLIAALSSGGYSRDLPELILAYLRGIESR